MTIRRSLWVLLLVITAAVMAVAFAALKPQPQPTPRSVKPTVTPRSVKPTVRPKTITPLPVSHSTATFKVNLDEYAPPGRGRDLLIENCSNCHTFACALIGQRTAGHWLTVENTHRDRIGINLSDRDYGKLFNYLEKNFNDQKPEPVLPPDLLGKGCTTPFR